MNFSSHWWSSSSDCSESDAIIWNWRSKAAIALVDIDALVFFLLSVGLKGDDRSTECDFHERVSSDEEPLLLNALRNLSTSRLWNLFKLFWLPTFAGFGGDALLTLWVRVGLMISDDCEFREFTRENWYRDPADETWWRLRCEGELNASLVPGDVDRDAGSEVFLERLFIGFVGTGRLFPFCPFIL